MFKSIDLKNEEVWNTITQWIRYVVDLAEKTLKTKGVLNY